MRSTIALVALLAGCARSENLQPLVAAAGSYSLIEAARRPSPPPAVDGCTEGCKCNGTGRERSGDGLSEVNCRCPDDCKCKAKRGSVAAVSGTICTTGTCAGWPPRNTSR